MARKRSRLLDGSYGVPLFQLDALTNALLVVGHNLGLHLRSHLILKEEGGMAARARNANKQLKSLTVEEQILLATGDVHMERAPAADAFLEDVVGEYAHIFWYNHRDKP